MLSRFYPVLWISIRVSKEKNFSLSLPLSLIVLEELLDSVLDLFEIAVWFMPNKKPLLVDKANSNYSSNSFSPVVIAETLKATRLLFRSLRAREPYDLVDVTTDDVRVLIKIL